MKLFTKDIDKKLFEQYQFGNDLEKQKVVAKIFNPYGRGTFYLLNSDVNDPDYIWAIIDLFEVEIGSISRNELETMKVPPFRLGLERDMYFEPVNAAELYRGLLSGKHYDKGGETDEDIVKSNSLMVLSQIKEIKHHADEISNLVSIDSNIEAWVVGKIERASTDLSDITHYLDGKSSYMTNDEFEHGGYMADGGKFGVDKHRIYFSTLGEVIDAIHDIAAENGYDIVEIFPDLTYGGIGYGQTKKVKAELEWNGKEKQGKSKKREKNILNVSIYRMDSGNYELNTYFAYAEGGELTVSPTEKANSLKGQQKLKF